MRRRLAIELGERLLVGKRGASQEIGEALAAFSSRVRVERHGPIDSPKLALLAHSAHFAHFASSRAMAILAPKHVADVGFAVEHARQHEQQVGKTVEILARRIAYRLA